MPGVSTDETTFGPRILTPDQRPRVFISSTLQELAPERAAARAAVERLRLIPVHVRARGSTPSGEGALSRLPGAEPRVRRPLLRAVRLGRTRRGDLRARGRVPAVRRSAAAGLPQGPGAAPRAAAGRRCSTRSGRTTRCRTSRSAPRRSSSACCPRTSRCCWPSASCSADRTAPSAMSGPTAPLLGRCRRRSTPCSGEPTSSPRSNASSPTGSRLVTCRRSRRDREDEAGAGGSPPRRCAAMRTRWRSSRSRRSTTLPRSSRRSPPRSGWAWTAACPSLDALAGAFGDRPFVLLLDNFEQVLPAATDVAELLTRCPAITIVVTSRAALRIRGEMLLPLGPLSLPSDEDPGS